MYPAIYSVLMVLLIMRKVVVMTDERYLYLLPVICIAVTTFCYFLLHHGVLLMHISGAESQ